MGTSLIKNATIWNGEAFLHADILIVDGVVAEIKKDISFSAEFVFDAGGRIVSAGLVDAHMHMRGISCKEHGTPIEASCFPFGVTTAVDAGASNENGDKEYLEQFMVKSRVFVPVTFGNNKPDFKKIKDVLLNKYQDKVVGLKVCFDTTIHDVQTIEPLKEVSEFAREYNLKIMVHSSNSPVPMMDIVEALGKGDILTHAYHGGKNNALEDNFECLRLAKTKGVYVDTGMAGYVHTDFAVYKSAILNGVTPDIISTDLTRLSAFKRGGRYGMTMCMSIAKSFGMDEKEIFKAVTSTPSKALGMEKESGILKIGTPADVAVLEYGYEPFDMTDKSGNRIFGERGYRCVLTIANGEVVYRA